MLSNIDVEVSCGMTIKKMSMVRSWFRNGVYQQADKWGVITSVACMVHCVLFPLLSVLLPILKADLLEHPIVEWSFILLALFFGGTAMLHGFRHHHRRLLPALLFLVGFTFLVLKMLTEERMVYGFIPASMVFTISAHWINHRWSKQRAI
jgi:hypothetical protein